MGRIWIYTFLLISLGISVVISGSFDCTECPKGMGVVSLCNFTTDTVCEICPPDTYSNVMSAIEDCRPCSRCGEDLYELHPCTPTSDVFCELCEWTKAVPNEDYYIKCVPSKKVFPSMLRVGGLEPDEVSKENSNKTEIKDDAKEKPQGEDNKDVDLAKVNATQKSIVVPETTYKGPKVKEINMDKVTHIKTTGTTTAYTGPKIVNIGAKQKTHIPTTHKPTVNTGPKIAGLERKVKTRDPKTTKATTRVYTGSKVKKLELKRRTVDPKKALTTPEPYTGPGIKRVEIEKFTKKRDPSTARPTLPYTGPKIGKLGLKQNTHNPLKTTVDVVTVYTGPKMVKFGIKKQKNIATPKTPTVNTGPRFGKNVKLAVKTFDPMKTTPDPSLINNGPKVKNINLKVKKGIPTSTSTVSTVAYTGPRLGKIWFKRKTPPAPTTISVEQTPTDNIEEDEKPTDNLEDYGSGIVEEGFIGDLTGHATLDAVQQLGDNERPGNLGSDGHSEVQRAGPSSENEKKSGGYSVFSIAMVALAVGVIFFVIGFAVDRWRHRKKPPINQQYEFEMEEMPYRGRQHNSKAAQPKLLPNSDDYNSESPVAADDAENDGATELNPLVQKQTPPSSNLRVQIDSHGSHN